MDNLEDKHTSQIAEQIRQKLPPLKYPECYDYIMSLSEDDYAKYLKLIYFYEKRIILDYDNPRYLSEKIQCLKLFDATDEKTRMTDKISVRDYVAKTIGSQYLREIYQVGNHFQNINFKTLPNDFYLKCNHGCKFHYYIKNKQKLLEIPALVKILENKFEKWLSMNFIGVGILEMQYKNIVPKIFAEENLMPEDGNLNEYQFWCFHGQPELIEKMIFSRENYRVLWDEKLTPSSIKFAKRNNFVETPPKEMDEMLELAKALSKGINFVRVDFIVKNGKIYFNEMTFSPFSGFLPLCKADDLLLGTYLNIK